jgi:hypothetical protein
MGPTYFVKNSNACFIPQIEAMNGDTKINKGALISKSILLWLKSPKKMAQKNYHEHLPPKEKMFRILSWHLIFRFKSK